MKKLALFLYFSLTVCICTGAEFRPNGKTLAKPVTPFSISGISKASSAVVSFAGGTELVTNGDCEAGIPAIAGVGISPFTYMTRAQSTDYAYSGSNSIKVYGDGVNSTYYQVYVNGNISSVIGDGYYIFSAKLYTPSASSDITHVDIGYYNTTSTFSYNRYAVSYDAWIPITIVCNDTKVLSGFNYVIRGINSGSANFISNHPFYLEDVSIKPLHNFSAGDAICLRVPDEQRLGPEIFTGGDCSTNIASFTGPGCHMTQAMVSMIVMAHRQA